MTYSDDGNDIPIQFQSEKSHLQSRFDYDEMDCSYPLRDQETHEKQHCILRPSSTAKSERIRSKKKPLQHLKGSIASTDVHGHLDTLVSQSQINQSQYKFRNDTHTSSLDKPTSSSKSRRKTSKRKSKELQKFLVDSSCTSHLLASSTSCLIPPDPKSETINVIETTENSIVDTFRTNESCYKNMPEFPNNQQLYPTALHEYSQRENYSIIADISEITSLCGEFHDDKPIRDNIHISMKSLSHSPSAISLTYKSNTPSEHHIYSSCNHDVGRLHKFRGATAPIISSSIAYGDRETINTYFDSNYYSSSTSRYSLEFMKNSNTFSLLKLT